MNYKSISCPCDVLSDNNGGKGCFIKIGSYNAEVGDFIGEFYRLAAENGAIIENHLNNPSSEDISFCEKFLCDRSGRAEVITAAVKSICPVTDKFAVPFSDRAAEILAMLREKGKNDTIIHNTLVKFLCWVRRDLSRAAMLSEKKQVRILCRGELTSHEIYLLSAMAAAGCYVMYAEDKGRGFMQKADPEGKLCSMVSVENSTPFPADFSFAGYEKETNERKKLLQLSKSGVDFCTNAWITGELLNDIASEPKTRGNDAQTVYNCFVRMNGTENKQNCLNELYDFYMKLKDSRKPLILDNSPEPPTNEEIGFIKRGNYNSAYTLISEMSQNIVHANQELQKHIRCAFSAVMAEYCIQSKDLRKAVKRAVYLLCWLRRFQNKIFAAYKECGMGCLIYTGGTKNEYDALFVRMIAYSPCDVLILRTDLSDSCCVEDSRLYERNYTDSLKIEKFPRESTDISMGTVAYYAERELDTMMYTDSGLYRNFQYSKSNAVNLRTMYEEIPLLWNEELKYRPNFSVSGDIVNIPVVMAKISGVKDNDLPRYWNEIHGMITPDTIVLKNEPLVTEEFPCDYTVPFYSGGRLSKKAVKEHKLYKYGFLKEEIQNHMLDKLELLLERKIIADSESGGMIYKIMSIALNMDSRLLRLMQKFDFTKKNPKLICIRTGEELISREDSILLAYLNLLGFDVIFYVPTGYVCAEKYYSSQLMEIHETGEYVFDLRIPDLNKKQDSGKSFFKRLFSK